MLLCIPAWFSPPLVRDSFWIDIVWADQFSDQLRAGIFYPRWLPQSHDGLGAAVFYFYPPLAFYLTAALSLIGLSTYSSVIAAFGVALAGSGLAMFHWLKGWTQRPLVAALVYMAAPYHLLDFYKRGALAEFCAFAIVPIIAIGMRRAASARRFDILSVAYAALIMTHLPAALLTSILFIAPYGMILAGRSRASLYPIGLGVLFGIGLASLYLLPMLSLQQFVSLEMMVAHPDFQVANWSVLTQYPAGDFSRMQFILNLCAAISFAAIVLLFTRGNRWAWATIGYCVIVLGFVPGFWSMPLLAKVQFPWRALMLAEFALLTAFAQARFNFATTMAITPALLFSSMMLQVGTSHQSDGSGKIVELLTHHPDVNEYLPKGVAPATDVYSQSALDLARDHPKRARVGGDTIAPHFYFPSWEVRCNGVPVATRPDPATKLLRWTGGDCDAHIVTTPYERIGLALSALFLIGLALLSARSYLQSAPNRFALLRSG